MNIRKIFLLITLCAVMVLISGCFKKNEEPKVVPSGDVEIKSGDTKIEDNSDYEKVYGNGTGIVNYKGDIYYVEYGNADFDVATIGLKYPFWAASNAQRYINKIDNRGNVSNLFKVTASTYFGIVDDRFYLRTINNQLYTVNMHGENTVELAKGDYIAMDVAGHSVYYQNDSNPNVIYKVDTQTLSIKTYDFSNPAMLNNYNVLTAINGIIYYSLLDEKNEEIILVEHNVIENKTSEVAKLNLSSRESYDSMFPRTIADSRVEGDYGAVCIATPNDGTMGGYYDGEIYTFDFANKRISRVNVLSFNEGPFFDDLIYDSIEKELYKLNYKDNLKYSETNLFSEKEKSDFAKKYKIDLDAKLGDEAKDSGAFSPESNKYVIDIEDFNIVGNYIMFKVTASRANPNGEIGWRPAYIRVASEVYVKDVITGKNQFVYSYVNDKFEEQIKEILKESNKDIEPSGEEIIGNIIEEQKQLEETLKDDEMYLTIDFTNLWKKEFDVRVEEVGGTIFGKRIEYEGHHTKDEKQIKLKVSKEVGAMLTVYVDNDLHSQFVIQQDN